MKIINEIYKTSSSNCSAEFFNNLRKSIIEDIKELLDFNEKLEAIGRTGVTQVLQMGDKIGETKLIYDIENIHRNNKIIEYLMEKFEIKEEELK